MTDSLTFFRDIVESDLQKYKDTFHYDPIKDTVRFPDPDVYTGNDGSVRGWASDEEPITKTVPLSEHLTHLLKYKNEELVKDFHLKLEGFKSIPEREAYLFNLNTELTRLIERSKKKKEINQYPYIKSCLEHLLEEVNSRIDTHLTGRRPASELILQKTEKPEYPLRFFIDLINTDRTEQLKGEFVENFGHDWIEFEDTDEKGNSRTVSISFTGDLTNTLKKEKEASLDYIRTHILEFKNIQEKETFLGSIVKELTILLQKFEGKPEIKKYPAIKSCLESLLEEVKGRMGTKSGKSTPGSKGNSGFIYNNRDITPEKITELRDNLVPNLIPVSVSVPQFKKIFSGKIPDEPIIWVGTVSELVYLIRGLEKTGKFDMGNIWQITCECFVKENERQKFEPTKMASQQLPSEKKMAAIDEILKIFD